MTVKRLAFAFLAFAFFVAVAPRPATASDQADVMATVRQFVDNFNSGKTEAAIATCDSPAFIVDEFPPHTWSGSTACTDWFSAYDTDSKKNGVTDGVVTLGAPWHVDVTGDRAYVVAPTIYAYKQHGKPVKEPHSVLTVALRKTSAGWRITAWTWSKH